MTLPFHIGEFCVDNESTAPHAYISLNHLYVSEGIVSIKLDSCVIYIANEMPQLIIRSIILIISYSLFWLIILLIHHT